MIETILIFWAVFASILAAWFWCRSNVDRHELRAWKEASEKQRNQAALELVKLVPVTGVAVDRISTIIDILDTRRHHDEK